MINMITQIEVINEASSAVIAVKDTKSPSSTSNAYMGTINPANVILITSGRNPEIKPKIRASSDDTSGENAA
jgi:hypothetical protein